MVCVEWGQKGGGMTQRTTFEDLLRKTMFFDVGND